MNRKVDWNMSTADTFLEVDVCDKTGRKVCFTNVRLGAGSYRAEGYTLEVGDESPFRVTIRPDKAENTPVKITYRYNRPIKNWHKIIVPNSGRHFMTDVYMVNIWTKPYETIVNDTKMPVTILTGQNMKTALAFGVLGDNVETRFRILGFSSPLNTLIVYRRRFTMQIERGFDDFLLPDDLSTRAPDGSVTEYLYLRSPDEEGETWVETLRDFSEHQRRLLGLEDVVHRPSLDPLWCSWTDWLSLDVDEKLMLDAVREGVPLGIKNYILDDGWFGHGLDTEDHPNQVGDYYPDTKRFPDLRALSGKVRGMGGRLILWVGPHCVAKGTRALDAIPHLLILNDKGERAWNGQYHAICLMSPEGRRHMVDMVRRFITDYDVDGVKMDLFNSIPSPTCCSREHGHDTPSMLRGLERLLKEICATCKALKPDFIIELKQNYATPFLSRYGTLTRAGDTAYNNEGNFMRAAHIAAYTGASENDYMTVTREDTALETAIIVIKMMAVGVPTYSNRFDIMPQTHKDIQKHYHAWYGEKLDACGSRRTPVDADLCVWRMGDGEGAAYFVVNNGQVVCAGQERTFDILNGTERDAVFLRRAGEAALTVTMFDMFGNEAGRYTRRISGAVELSVPPGGRISVRC